MESKIKSCNTISFVDIKTGEVKLKTKGCERITFNTFQNKEPIGKLIGSDQGKLKMKNFEIDIYTIEEVDGKIIINDYIELGVNNE